MTEVGADIKGDLAAAKQLHEDNMATLDVIEKTLDRSLNARKRADEETEEVRLALVEAANYALAAHAFITDEAWEKRLAGRWTALTKLMEANDVTFSTHGVESEGAFS